MNEQIERARKTLKLIEDSISDMEEGARRPDLDARRDELLAALGMVRENVRALHDDLGAATT